MYAEHDERLLPLKVSFAMVLADPPKAPFIVALSSFATSCAVIVKLDSTQQIMAKKV
jgi:hypothetical protein